MGTSFTQDPRKHKQYGFLPPFLVNRSFGPRLEAALERLPLVGPFLPFQLFSARKPG